MSEVRLPCIINQVYENNNVDEIYPSTEYNNILLKNNGRYITENNLKNMKDFVAKSSSDISSVKTEFDTKVNKPENPGLSGDIILNDGTGNLLIKTLRMNGGGMNE